MFWTLVSCFSAGIIAIIDIMRVTKPPALSRPAAASRPAKNSSSARPTAPINCTTAEEILRVDSTFIDRRRFSSASAP